MKKELIIAAALLTLLVAPAFAAKPTVDNGSIHSNGKSDVHNNQTNDNNENVNVNDENTVTPSPTQTVTEDLNQEGSTISPTVSPSVSPAAVGIPCDPSAHWKNHGEYVSCVAHLHQGGKIVSEAAKSDVGKKDIDESPTPSASPSPTVTPITSANPTLQSGISPLSTIGTFFGKIFGFLKHLL